MKVEQLFSEKEAANILCLSVPTLKKWRYSKKISYLKLGHAVRYSESHLENILNDSKREVSS